MKFEKWLEDFVRDKSEVSRPDLDEKQSYHGARRFVDKRNVYWEFAKTYTGRLITRRGLRSSDGVLVVWEAWTTLHDVEVD